MSINLQLPALSDLRPRLTVVGVGGAGCNAVNNMIAAGLTGVEFIVANTDAQALAASSAEHRLQLGVNLTEGLGAGSKPEIGEAAAEEAIDEIRSQISGSHMLFLAAGMGGGTGTGACSVIARIARDMGILVVGVVTKPFMFEGTRRQRTADAGIAELRKHVDTLIVIPNQNLFRIANEKTTFAEAFVLADQVLYSGVACIVDLILKDGLINLDFADVRTIMSGMGTAMMGTGEASGDRRAIMAAEEAISNPLLDDVTLRGARGLLLSITGSHDMTLYEVDEAASRVRQEVDAEANIIVGATFDDSLGDAIRVSIVASGMARMGEVQASPPQPDRSGQWQPSGGGSRSAADAGTQSWSEGAPQGAGATPPSAGQSTGTDTPAPHHSPAYEQLLSQAIPASQDAIYGNTGGAAAQRRETWAAPGNVTIEAGYQPVPGTTAAPPPPLPSGGYAMGEPPRSAAGEPFRAQPPVDVRRGGRRMPEVEDFPVVGQRDYYAKVSAEPPRTGTAPGGVGSAQQSRGASGRKPGLFERIAGMGRKPDDSASDSRSNPSNGVNRGAPGQYGAGSGAAGAGGERPAGAPTGNEEAAELPMFFNKKR